MKLSKTSFKLLVVIFCSTLLLVSISACSKDKKKAAKKSGGSAAVVAKSDILKSLPDSTGAVVYWNMTSPAYKKLNNSPWKASSYTSMTPGPQTTIGGVELVGFFQKHGIDINKKEDVEKLFSEAAFFSTKWRDTITPVGLVFKTASDVDSGKILNDLKEELKKNGNPISDLQVKGVNGFKVDVELPGSTAQNIGQLASGQPSLENAAKQAQNGFLVDGAYIAWANNKIAVSNTDEHIKAGLLTAKGGKIPSVLTDGEFKKITDGFQASSNQLALGVANLNKLHPDASKNTSFRNAAFEVTMKDKPQADVRLAYDAKQAPDTSLFKTISASSSESTANYVSEKPMLYLSLDGQTLARLQPALAALSGKPTTGGSNDLVQKVKRLAIAAKVAPPGQFMFPIPALSILVETDSAEEAQKKYQSFSVLAQGLVALSGGMMQPSGELNPGTGLQTKKIGETEVKYMLSPMGVGLYLAQVGNAVVATLDESEMNKIVSASGKSFVSQLKKKSTEILSVQDTVMNFYFDFEQLGSLVENLGGLLSMYAPQSPEAQELLKKENIDAMKKMGKAVGSLTHDPGLVRLVTYYE